MSKEMGDMESKAIFEAAQVGDFKLLKDLYIGSINQVNKEQLNLLSVVLTESDKIDDRMKIINFLLDRGIDINYQDRDGRTALHNFFQFKANWRPNVDYAVNVIAKLIEAGININAIDKYGSVALIYSLTVLKLTTQDAFPIYELLLKHNVDYTLKNDAGKSALDYAKELSWRNDFLNILEKYENESK